MLSETTQRRVAQLQAAAPADQAEHIFTELYRRELGVHNWADDRGGKTAHGITERVANREGYDIEEITPEIARAIYRRRYYEAPGFSEIGDVRLRYRLTLDALHSGAGTVSRRLQSLLNMTGGHKPNDTGALQVDGIVGPATLTRLRYTVKTLMPTQFAAAEGLDPPRARELAALDFSAQLLADQYGLYRGICSNDPTQLRWFRGWVNRIRYNPSWYAFDGVPARQWAGDK